MSDTASQFSDTLLPSTPPTETPAAPVNIERRLRLWPGVAIIAIQWAAISIIGMLFPATPIQFMAMFMGPMIGAGLFLLYWLFFSRISWLDRLLIPVACAAFASSIFITGHESIGMFGLIMQGLPAAISVWVLWLILTYPIAWPVRRYGLLVVLLLTWSYFSLIRLDGISGGMAAEINWRWTPTNEQKFLAERGSLAATNPAKEAAPLVLQAGDWPGFRGANRDNRITGVKIATDWTADPPKLLWKHRVGPGWGSFAVIGKHVFTQEQWDQKEAVVCYDGDTGKMLWQNEYPGRFTEVVAGPGPRATPTFHDGKLYTMGAAGKLCCLDAATGREIWSRDIVADSGAKVPQWGFAASPLVHQGVVMVFAGGPSKAVVAYAADSGSLAWTAGEDKLSYCSLHLAKIDGVEQAILASGDGLTSFEPKSGYVLWEHKWLLEGAARCVQPAFVGDSDLLLGSGFGSGIRRLSISHKDNKWENKEVWTSKVFSPYFNDFVVQGDHLFGFNTEIFTCLNLDKGKAAWKERGYGCGQVLLLVDQNLLLITTEKGEVALVEASADEHKELARFKAIDGKTWNHPVLAHGRLYVRNGEEAACYQLKEIK